MKTFILSKCTKSPNELKRTFELLWRFPNEKRLALFQQASEILVQDTKIEQDLYIDRILKGMEGNRNDNLKIIKLLMFIYDNWMPIVDPPSDFFEDIQNLQLIPSKKMDEAKSFIFDLYDYIEKDKLQYFSRFYSRQILPNFKSLSSVIDFRAVLKPGFYEPTETEIKDYSPECIDLVPVISFELELENNVNKTIFQCDSDDLETIIKLFQAARKDLDSANQYLMKKGKNF